MKKSWGHFALFVFVLALSIFVPVYILFTGSATLMPLAQAGAILVAAHGLLLALTTANNSHQAGRNASIPHHDFLVLSREDVASRRAWRDPAVVIKCLAQAILLLSLGLPFFAALAVLGLTGWVVHRGILESYFDRLPHWKKPCSLHEAHKGKHGVGAG